MAFILPRKKLAGWYHPFNSLPLHKIEQNRYPNHYDYIS